MSDGNKQPPNKTEALIEAATIAELLEEVPLHSPRLIEELFMVGNDIRFPQEIRVHCPNPTCDGVRRHLKLATGSAFNLDLVVFQFACYQCTDCTTRLKVFGLRGVTKKASRHGTCTKIYQEPAFGQSIPKRLFQVIGEDNREYFLQARRAIARGLGIGAYAYYRRIVENTKFDLVKSVLQVAERTGAASEQIALLQDAQKERQFSKAIEKLGDVSAIPAILLIEGQNPLTLLHDLLSEGIHELSDAECLERAQEAEVILSETATRMQIALTEQKSVKAAVSSVLNRRKRKNPLPSPAANQT